MKFLVLMFLLSPHLSLANTADSEKEEAKVDVFITRIKPKTVYDAVRYGGFVRSGDVQELYTPIEGHLEKVFVKLGDKVKKGDRLYSFNPSVVGQLYKKQIVRAPRAGTVSYIASHDTSRYKAGETLMTISNVKKKSVRLYVTYEDMVFLKTTPPVDLIAHGDTKHEKVFAASILAISPAANSVTSTFAVDVLLVDPADEVPVGSFVEANFKKNMRQSIVVPITALNNKRTKVFIVNEENKIDPTEITLGKYFRETVEVTAGLKVGQTLVTKYAEKPKKGDLANVLTPKDRQEKIDAAATEKSKSRG